MGPGHAAPTIAEQAWLRAITSFGCVACYLDGYPETPPAIHHIVEGNKRLGHRFTLPLCPPHHQPDSRSGKVSLHPGVSKRFVAQYGTERGLLARLERKLGFPPAQEKRCNA